VPKKHLNYIFIKNLKKYDMVITGGELGCEDLSFWLFWLCGIRNNGYNLAACSYGLVGIGSCFSTNNFEMSVVGLQKKRD